MDAFPRTLFCFGNLLARLPDGEVVHDVLNVWRNDLWFGCGEAKRPE